MRKLAILAVTAFVLSVTATAFAQQTNTYEITGSTTPKTAGSKKKPRPIGINFGFKVGEQAGLRPAVVRSYAISFSGTRVNKNVAAACRVSVLQRTGGTPSDCPKRSIVGTGFIKNATGDINNPADKSITCNVKLTVVNHAGSRASIFIQGDPNSSDIRTKCQIPLSAPIPATFKNTSKGTTLTFEVPQSLRHPLPTLSNAVTEVTSKIKRLTKRGKGFYEARGCTGGKRTVSVKFTTEAGQSKTASKKISCR